MSIIASRIGGMHCLAERIGMSASVVEIAWFPARRVTRLEPDGSLTVVPNRYHDRRLNRPNDLVVKSDGSIYFTDPATFNVESELDFSGVYRVSADLGTINLLV